MLSARAPIYIPQHHHRDSAGPGGVPPPAQVVTAWGRGRGESEGPAGLPGATGSPGPATAERPRCDGPGGHRHRSLCAKTLLLTRPSPGFFFFLIVFKTDFMWSQNETMIVN